MDGHFFVPRKTTYPIDGWMDGWMGIGMRVMGNEGENEGKNGLLASFPSAAPMQKINKTGRSKSPECIHHIASYFTCRWRSVQLKEICNLKTLIRVCEGAQESLRESVWDQISGERRWRCLCAKILVRLQLEHEPFFLFVHFQFASVLTLNFAI